MANTYPRFQASGSFAYSLYVNSVEADGSARSSNGIVKRRTLFAAAIECPIRILSAYREVVDGPMTVSETVVLLPFYTVITPRDAKIGL